MNNLVFLLGIFLPCLVLMAVSGQKIIRLETKTADVDEAEMGIGGSIAVELLMRDATYCRIEELSSDGFNFQQGKIDVFVGEDLGACANFTAPGGEIARLTLSHSGIDNWLGEYLAVFMDDATYVFCPDGEYIDNAQIHDLTCTGVLAHNEVDDSEDFDQWLENVN